jgi:hypothetical protein
VRRGIYSAEWGRRDEEDLAAEAFVMTGKEVVQRAISFQHPDRLPFDMPVSGPSDVFRVRAGRSSDPRVKDRNGGRRYVDHFGCEFEILNDKDLSGNN